MMDRRSLLQYGSATVFSTLAIAAVSGAGTPALAAELTAAPADHRTPLPDPATTPVRNNHYPKGLTPVEKKHLQTFDELDFVVFSHAEWARMGESHAKNVRVHMPDGSFTDGLDKHVFALQAVFAFAPDTRIEEHPIRVATNDLTAVTGVMRGTFTQPMPDGKGGFTPPTGRKYAINMATVGVWNAHGLMDEEFLFWDNLTFYRQLGLL